MDDSRPGQETPGGGNEHLRILSADDSGGEDAAGDAPPRGAEPPEGEPPTGDDQSAATPVPAVDASQGRTPHDHEPTDPGLPAMAPAAGAPGPRDDFTRGPTGDPPAEEPSAPQFPPLPPPAASSDASTGLAEDARPLPPQMPPPPPVVRSGGVRIIDADGNDITGAGADAAETTVPTSTFKAPPEPGGIRVSADSEAPGAPEPPAEAGRRSGRARLRRRGGVAEAEVVGAGAPEAAAVAEEVAEVEDDGGGGEDGEVRPQAAVKVLTGLAFGVVVFVLMRVFGRPALAGLGVVLVTLCAYEYYAVLAKHGARPALVIGVVAIPAIMLLAYLKGVEPAAIVLIASLVATGVWFAGTLDTHEPPVPAAATIVGLVHMGVGGIAWSLILVLPHGFAIGVVFLVMCVTQDVAAYAVGSTLGRRPLAPSLSPHKSVEGFVGGTLGTFAVAGATILMERWHHVAFLGEPRNVLVLGAVVAVVAPLGDLAESLIKRTLGIKDFGALLPGHGGMFDRFDAILLALPAAWITLMLLGAS